MKKSLLHVIILLLGIGIYSSSKAQSPVNVQKTNPKPILMHMMPWFDGPKTLGAGNWGYHWKMQKMNPNIIVDPATGKRQIASNYYPQIGPYDSSDPDVVDYQLLLMKLSGVDGVLIDWYGTEGTVGDIGSNLRNSNAIVNGTGPSGLKFGLVIEDRFTGGNTNTQRNSMLYARDNYFSKSNYYRYGPGNDPLVGIFGPEVISDGNAWSNILSGIEDIEFLPLEYQGAEVGSNMDGEYAWPYQTPNTSDHYTQVENFYKFRAPNLKTAMGVAYPGFNDFYAQGEFNGRSYFNIPHNGTSTLNQMLNLNNQYSNDVDIVQLATWNDYGEGTMFEPTMEFGYSFLVKLQQFTGVPYTEADLRQVTRFYNLRKQYQNNSTVRAQLDQVYRYFAALQITQAVNLMCTIDGAGGCTSISSSTDVITAYNDCDYNGFSGGLTIGDYNLAKLRSLGIENDVISSLKITQGFKAILFQDDNFTGGFTEINSDNACLNLTWNNKVTSIRVLANGVTNLAGTYYLNNRNSGLNMDVAGGPGAIGDGANIQQWTAVQGATNQQFKLEHLGDGMYKITAVHSGKSLDVNSFNKANGANVEQYTYNATPNQQFIAVDAGAGYYKLVARHSGRIVEVAGCSQAAEANVQQWDNNNQPCGMWKLVTLNTLPIVSITSPSQNASFISPANINILANASNANGSISKVEFFNGAVKLGEDLTSPYSFSWNGVLAGNYALTAKATNNTGGVTTSSAVLVSVSNPVVKSPFGGARANIPGIIEAEQYDMGGQNIAYYDLSTANEGGAFRSDAVDIEATSSGGYNVGWIQNGEWLDYSIVINTSGNYKIDARIAAVADGKTFALQLDGVTLGSFSVPNTGGWQNWQIVTLNNIVLTAGQKTLRILATSTDLNIDQLSFTTTVVSNNSPSINLTSPLSNATYNAPTSIVIAANASDVDGTISKVEFYNGETKLGESSTSPYTFTWSNVTAGTYSIAAKAFDNKNASTTSASVTVKVNTVVVTNTCSGIAAYAENSGYVPGSIVNNGGNKYQCKPYPYSGWCNGAAWAYSPGTGAYWTDAWTSLGTCNARTGEDASTTSANINSAIGIAPNPANAELSIISDLNINNSEIQIIDVMGRVVVATVYNGNTINLNSLNAGMYTIIISTEQGERVTKSFIKQ